jgi:ABC-type phosphate/phosphonate transport system substrate-binding protein
MKTSNMLKGLVLGLALLLTTGAFAANKGSLQVSDTVNVSGKQLAPGEYKLAWDGTGQNVELKIMKGKDVVATVPAHIVEMNVPAYYSSAVVNNNSDGSKSLSEIRFAGKKFALALGGETAKAEGATP